MMSQPRSQGLSSLPSVSLRKKTQVQAGHVPPEIWEVNQICVRGWEAMYAFSS